MLLPSLALPPLKHLQSQELMVAFWYTASLNALDFPAGVIPNVLRITDQHLEDEYDDPEYPNDNA